MKQEFTSFPTYVRGRYERACVCKYSMLSGMMFLGIEEKYTVSRVSHYDVILEFETAAVAFAAAAAYILHQLLCSFGFEQTKMTAGFN